MQLVPNAWRQASPRVVGLLLLGRAAAIPVGTALLGWADPTVMKRVISGAILGLGLIVLAGWRFHAPLTVQGYTGVGALAGVIMGATGIAAVLPLFLNAGQDSAARNRAHFILWVFVASLWTCLMLAFAVQPGTEILILISVLLPAYAIGMFVGNRLVTRLSDPMLRRAVLLLVISVAIIGLIL